MTTSKEKTPLDLEREALEDHLSNIEDNPDALNDFLRELYSNHAENPQIFYATAARLTALRHLERRDQANQLQLPPQEDAAQAFSDFAHLIAMLDQEKRSPRYTGSRRIIDGLIGTQEELAFLAPLAYTRAMGGDFVALPTPARLDFTGTRRSSDVRIFFPGNEQPELDIQVKRNLATLKTQSYDYLPYIAVLNLAVVLGGDQEAVAFRGMLKSIGRRDNEPSGELSLQAGEHDTLMFASAAILKAAKEWQEKQNSTQAVA